MFRFPIIAVGFWILLLAGISAAPAAEPNGEAAIEYFETHIRPLLARHCFQCHSQRAEEKQGNLLLDHREGWIEGGDSGPSVVPGDVDASLLIRAVRYDEPALEMPPSGPLDADEVEKLEHWVRMGAPGPRGDLVAMVADPSDPVAGRSHWAFQPVQRPQPPDVQDASQPQSVIDRFVLARLEEEGLDMAPPAEPRDLVRRLYFQLTGLPPSPQQARALLNDQRADAYARLVDRLLASPAFGQRWGRHWLDLARYADSNGMDENFLFREAWRYRNWVIAAVSDDLPFDRFLLEQIAGDLLPYASMEQRDRQRIATGLLVVGPKVLLAVDAERQRMDVADEQIDTIGRAILGQTLGCARCHDHKFDPIPTADYYALAGIFTSTQVMERRFMLNQQRAMEQLVGLGVNGIRLDEAYEAYWRERPKLKEKAAAAKSALQALEARDDEGFARVLAENADAIAADAQDAGRPLEQRIAAQDSLAADLAAKLGSPPSIPPRAMVASDSDPPRDECIRIAGQFDQPAERVQRGFLTVLSDGESAEIPSGQSGRLELARWLTDADGRAGQLAARVLANRIWRHLIGQGLIRTVDNFGRTGEPPSHPELLDYLASELIDSGWSVKALIRQIVLSQTFTQSSRYDAAAFEIDPENRWLWRAHRRRLEPEALRDAMLSAAGQLDLTPMESTVWYLGDQATAVGANEVRRRTDFPCRSVYLPVIRNDLPELFQVFDFADSQVATGARPNTTVPTQSLYMLNDEAVTSAAEATARRIIRELPAKDNTARIERMFDLAVCGPPSDQQLRVLQSFLSQTEDRLRLDGVEDAALRALGIACQAVFACSRFQFLE